MEILEEELQLQAEASSDLYIKIQKIIGDFLRENEKAAFSTGAAVASVLSLHVSKMMALYCLYEGVTNTKGIDDYIDQVFNSTRHMIHTNIRNQFNLEEQTIQ